MGFSAKDVFCGCVVILITTIGPVHNAPKTVSAKYDQKQTGEHNIQVHLKDFHIIAILGDDILGGNGDYDYNYDYTDLTIKPVVPLTTENPQNSTTSGGVDVEKPEEQKPDVIMSSSSTPNPFPTIPVVVISENPQVPVKTPVKLENAKPAKFDQESEDKKEESPLTNISILPPSTTGSNKKEINRNDQQVFRGELTPQRRCIEGFVKDKQGRCRKIRRTPNIPLGITRFATNLASKFRQATIGSNGSLH